MKGWIKGMLIVSAACVATGTVLGVCGWAMGGRLSYYVTRCLPGAPYWMVEEAREDNIVRPPEEIQAETGKAKETPMSREEAAESQKMGAEETEAPEPESQIMGQAERIGEVVPGGSQALFDGRNIRELDIIVEGARAIVTADESADTIEIICYDEDYRCFWETDEDGLEIQIRRRHNKNWSLLENIDMWEEAVAEIIIPAGALFDEADLEVIGGVLTVDQIFAGKLDLEIQGGKLEVLAGQTGELSGDCQAGELTYEGQVRWELDADCQAGSIRYLLEGKEEDFNYEIDVSMGKICIDGSERGRQNSETVLNNPGAVKTADLECEVGTIEIDFY